MRIVPILTAIAVIAVLFLLVFQREAVLSFAGLEPEAAAPVAAPAPELPGAGSEGPRRVSVVALDSSATEIDSAVVLRGRTEAARQVALMAETSGRVNSPPIAKGTKVAAGDLLCTLDIGTREATLAQAEASLAQARLAFDNAKALKQNGFAAETQVAAARAGYEAAEAALTAARRDIENTRISAPFAGVLESDTAELGALLQPGSPCATVLALDPIRLVGFVPELEVDRVTLGAPAGARLATGREVIGRVSFVSRSADPATRTFRVEAEVANPDLSIRDGQTAEILIQSAGRRAHLLPQASLTLADDGSLGVRVVGEDPELGAVARFVPVELLRDSPEGVWVAGLPDSAKVIVEGQDYVTDGVPLEVTMRESGS
jgi:multidrug efflux system membrane fusion protein